MLLSDSPETFCVEEWPKIHAAACANLEKNYRNRFTSAITKASVLNITMGDQILIHDFQILSLRGEMQQPLCVRTCKIKYLCPSV